jgi:hypothetical protein
VTERVHTFRGYRTPSGQLVPSVTTCLEVAGLTDLSMVPPTVLEELRLLGTAVHRACELRDRERLNRRSLTPAVAARLEQYERFLVNTGFVPVHIEHRMLDERLGLAGMLDRTGYFQDDDPALGTDLALVDLKSSLFPSVGPQLAGYATLLGKPAIPRYALVLTADNYLLVPYTDRTDFACFQAALAVTHWKLARGMIRLTSVDTEQKESQYA